MTEDSILNKANTTEDLFPSESLKEMVEAGVFYGRRKSKTYPKMKQFVLVNRGGIEIINLEKTLEQLKKAASFIEEKVKAGGILLFVGTQPPAFMAITDLAKKFGYPYVINRWLGGTITNFKVVFKRIDYLKKLRSDVKTGVLDKYTKKEKAQFESEMNRLEELLGGMEPMTRLPDAIIIIDPNAHQTAVREARIAKIPIITFANVDSDPAFLDYYVVGNNKSKKSVEWFLAKIEQAIEDGKKGKVATDAALEEAKKSSPEA